MAGADPERTGDPGERIVEAFEALRERLLGTALLVLGHREDAREAVQDAFLKCWSRRGQMAQVADRNAWVFTVLLNAARDIRRRRTVRRAAALPDEPALPASREPSPAAAAEGREEVARVRAALWRLPDTEREVFLLRQNGELTFEAIAGILDAPVGTVKTRMRAALRRLREVLGVCPAPAPVRART